VTISPTPVRRRPRRRSRARLVLAILAAVAAFAIGVALGQALEDNPEPGGTQTVVRTLKPLPLPPAARETVTVTTAQP
jgi:hypothetical protein